MIAAAVILKVKKRGRFRVSSGCIGGCFRVFLGCFHSAFPYPSRTKNQPKEEVFWADIPRTSGGHSRGYPGPKLRSGRSKSWENKHFSADIHDPKARTSTTLRDLQKLRSEKLWADSVFPYSLCGYPLWTLPVNRHWCDYSCGIGV